MAKKLPWFAWYADKWLSDEALRSVSIAARGLWVDMLSLMHKCDRRGYLQLAGKPVTAEQLARMTGCSTDEVSRLLAELLNSGVASVSEDGITYSRAMVRDEHKRQLCSTAGKRGGNPTLKGTSKGASKGQSKGRLNPASIVCVSSNTGSTNQEEINTRHGGVGGVGEGEATLKGRSKGRASDGLDSDFDRFWKAYPNKVSKVKARACWDRLSPDDELVERILAAVERQAKWDRWQRGFIPNPDTWLNQCRWDDEEPVKQRGNANGAGGSVGRLSRVEDDGQYDDVGTVIKTGAAASANGAKQKMAAKPGETGLPDPGRTAG